jgi:hypothetical protein
MKEQLDQELCAKYPKIFRDRNAPMDQTCMCWGFEHGDGWYNIIDQLCGSIQSHIDWRQKQHDSDIKYNEMIHAALAGNLAPLEEYFGGNWLNTDERMSEALERGLREVTPIVPQVIVAQVKEKFGTLRFYYSGGDDEISGMVRMAEAMSAVTCEQCGSPGEQRHGGWIRTLCDHHEEQYQNRNKEA